MDECKAAGPPITRRAVLLAIVLNAYAMHAWAKAADRPEPAGTVPLVFAAASMTEVLGELGREFQASTGRTVRFSFAASSALARQIEAGAPAEVFVSADQDWMDYLAVRKLVDPTSRRDVAGNALVLVAPADSTASVSMRKPLSLAPLLGAGRLAIADPDIVPAGRYARAALEALGEWAGVRDRLARAENVRVALAYVARGETPFGIVYATDARIEPRVRVLGEFPASSHPPIRYPAAVTPGAGTEARAFLEFITGPRGQDAFARHGFSKPG